MNDITVEIHIATIYVFCALLPLMLLYIANVMANVIIGQSIARIQNQSLRFDTSVRSGLNEIDFAIKPETRIRTRLVITPDIYADAVETAANSIILLGI